MKSFWSIALIAILAISGVGCPASMDDSEFGIGEFCDALALNEPDPNTAELEGMIFMCQLWQEGQISESEYQDFCSLDDQGKAALVDVDEYCTFKSQPDAILDFGAAVTQWRSLADEGQCGVPDAPLPSVYTGECGNGNVFLANGTGFGATFDFYDSESKSFVARLADGDFIVPPCCGQIYWPAKIECSDAVVTELICGEQVQVTVGESIRFP